MGVAHHSKTTGCISSVYELLGQKSVSFIWCIKAFKNLNGTKCFAEMDWKKFGKDQKPFATFLEIWQKIPAEEQNF